TGSSGPQEAAVRLAAALGCRSLLVTQAAGSLRPSLPPGSWMSASDVISFPFRAVACAPRAGGGPLISEKMRARVAAAAREAGVPVRDGILFWTPGPNYETRAESMMMEAAGADAVTMSPIPELAAARGLGMRASTLSWITNHTANVDPGGSGHESVVAMGRRGRGMLRAILEKLSAGRPE
ncbi:MAG TPA: hypothetical protein VLA34_01810, partial [Candidatus Krumholzibacterium sp.]|nr:hypothetical protein [Candidatus Krumholzibacterium sp.]